MEHQVSTTTLSDVPEEVIRLVFSRVPLVDKFKYERVCRTWQRVVYDMQYKLRFTRCKKPTNFCRHFGHSIDSNDCVPQLIFNSQKCYQSPVNMTVLECVLRKCGQSLVAINLDSALINESIFEMITQFCPNVQCLSLRGSTGITDQCLEIISNFYGKQLKHVNLECAANRRIYFSTDGLKKFLEMCPFLEVFHVASIRSQLNYRLNGQHLILLKNVKQLSAYLHDVPIEELFNYAQAHGSQLNILNIDGIIYSETTIKDITSVVSMFSSLKSLSLMTRCDIPLDTQLITMSRSLFLKEFRIRLHYITVTTIEAISYFANLETLEFGLWKPFESGLPCLSLEPLRFCPNLRDLQIVNFLDGDSLFQGIDEFCPNLEVLVLNNVYGCTDEVLHSLSKCQKLSYFRLTGSQHIAPEITESGVSEIISVCPVLGLLEIPCTFDLLPDGTVAKSLIDTATRRSCDRLTFVYGKISIDFELEKAPANLSVTRKFE